MAYLSELLGREVRDAKGILLGTLADVLISRRKRTTLSADRRACGQTKRR